MKKIWGKYRAGLIIGIVGSLFSLALYSLIEFATGKEIELSQKILLILILALVVIVLLTIIIEQIIERSIRPRIRQQLLEESEVALKEKEDLLREQLSKQFQDNLFSKSGIVQIYDNFDECEDEILSTIEKSESTKIFIQIGKTVLGGTTNLYDFIAGKNLTHSKEIKILHAGRDNPYLSEKVAVQRKSSYHEWNTDLQYAENKVNVIKRNNQVNLESRKHQEGYYWRIFIFDDVAYVQPYLYKRKNSSQAPVYKLTSNSEQKTNNNSLYHLFDKYFDTKWEECQPSNLIELNKYIDKKDVTVAASVIRYDQFYIFVIPKRYISTEKKEIPFHALGGKRNPNESWIKTLQREIFEEIGVAVKIEDSPVTSNYTTLPN